MYWLLIVMIYRLWNWSPSSSPPLPALGCLCRWIFFSTQAEFSPKWILKSNVSSVSAAKVILVFDNWGNLPLLLLTVDFLRIFSTERLLAFARLEGGEILLGQQIIIFVIICYHYYFSLLFFIIIYHYYWEIGGGYFVGQQNQFQLGSNNFTLSSLSILEISI